MPAPIKRRPPRIKKLTPKVQISFKLRPETIEMLKMGAAYHEVGWQTYTQWLIEQQLKEEQRYYGWQPVAKGKYVSKTVNPLREKAARRLIHQTMRVAKRKLARESLKALELEEAPTTDDPSPSKD